MTYINFCVCICVYTHTEIYKISIVQLLNEFIHYRKQNTNDFNILLKLMVNY